MMLRLVAASLRRRGRQLLLVGLAVAVAAATVAALVGFLVRARGGFGAELAAFGPNLTVRPQVGGPLALPAEALAVVRAVPGVESATAVGARRTAPTGGELRPEAATAAETGGEHAAGAAAEPTRGAVTRTADGETLAAPAGPRREAAAAGVDRSTARPAPTGAVAAGLVAIAVRAHPDRLAAVAAAIEARLPGAEARPLLRVSRAESELVRRVGWLLAAAALVSLLLALVSVGAATTALVVERRREVGLLMALGFSGRRISTLLAAELVAAALLAALAGELAGEAAAGRLAAGVLGRAGAISAASLGWGLPAAALAAVAVVAAALALALRRVEAVDPVVVLRGE